MLPVLVDVLLGDGERIINRQKVAKQARVYPTVESVELHMVPSRHARRWYLVVVAAAVAGTAAVAPGSGSGSSSTPEPALLLPLLLLLRLENPHHIRHRPILLL